MLLIRPVIRANQWRRRKAHVIIFFIFLVSNLGGCLTPLGDPPLFLGFLRGVPFFWTINLLPIMLLNAAILFFVFYLLDNHYYKKELSEGRNPKDLTGKAPKEPLKLGGAHNLFFIAMIVGAVILSGFLPNLETFANQATGELYGLRVYEGVVLSYNSIIQMGIILAAAFLSYKTTHKSVREDNCFSWYCIKEVAILFIGIFITMIPALALLRTHGTELGFSSPYQYFWATGGLSSFLDNAPPTLPS
jgi:Na+/H+ antiporter NhaD/arsenite permease-like protein